MAEVRLVDVYVPNTFRKGVQEAQIETNAFIASGVATIDPLITQQFAAGGNTGELPQYNGITAGEPNYSGDDPAVLSTPGKISSQVQKLRSASRNKSWSTMDLARELELQPGDALAAISGRIGHYWAVDDQTRLIQSTVGVLADNVANDSSDMLYKVGNDLVAAVTDAERISNEAIIRATQTMGDHKGKLRAIAMHSIQHTRLAIQEKLVTVRNSTNGDVLFQTFNNLRVIIDDSLPVTIGTNRSLYTSMLFGENAVGYGTGRVLTPSELSRNAAAGNGGGQSIITSRVNSIFHVNGASFLSASIAGKSASYAELAEAAEWDRIVARKNMPIAFLQTND